MRGGELFDRIVNFGPYEEHRAQKLVRGIFEGARCPDGFWLAIFATFLQLIWG